MKGPSIIISILTLGLLSSCMAAIHDYAPDTDSIRINGLVVDEGERPVDHIQVTMEWDSPDSPMVVYSSPKGAFSAEIEVFRHAYPVTVSVMITDVDGEENGGFFQKMNDEFTILEEGYYGNSNTPIVYRLTRATASESNRQSL